MPASSESSAQLYGTARAKSADFAGASQAASAARIAVGEDTGREEKSEFFFRGPCESSSEKSFPFRPFFTLQWSARVSDV